MPAAKLTVVVHALRAYGVLICVLACRDFERCRCLRSLAMSEIDEVVRARPARRAG